MEQQTVKSMTNEQLIGACVWLDREQKKSRAMMNSYKAELQARGLAIMEDHNVKYVKFYGDEGSAAITDSMSPVSYTHLRAHETRHDLVCRLLLEKKKNS